MPGCFLALVVILAQFGHATTCAITMNCSSSTCATLKSNATAANDLLSWKTSSTVQNACGASKIGGNCVGKKTWADAKTTCETAGARLCTCTDLYVHEIARGTGCISDENDLIWTSTTCAEGKYLASVNNHGGQPGEVVCTSAADLMDVRCCADSATAATTGCDASQTIQSPHLIERAAICAVPGCATTLAPGGTFGTNVKGTADECKATDACSEDAKGDYFCAASNGETQMMKQVKICSSGSVTDCEASCAQQGRNIKTTAEANNLPADNIVWACFSSVELTASRNSCKNKDLAPTSKSSRSAPPGVWALVLVASGALIFGA